MTKRYHLNRPDLAQAVAMELRTCQDSKSQQRLLAAQPLHHPSVALGAGLLIENDKQFTANHRRLAPRGL